ncbi:MAG TPA: hypothetical protein VGN63_19240 [Flavisolibacter sp.]|jgi:hypothetical protein|nr:hypothetical protein [Flavisolibacter sp.]
MFRLPSISQKSKQRRRFWLLLFICNGTVLLVNLFIGLLLHGNPFVPFSEGENWTAMLLAGTVLGSALFILNTALSLFESLMQKTGRKQGPLVMLCGGILLLSLTSCEIETGSRVQVKSAVQGSINNAATGLRAVYRNMEAERVKLVMNDEVLGHADIPLGEKFYIINEGIKGLESKEGKVSVGCSLQITDENGTIILNEPDLFQGNDVFNEKEVKYLRCAVSTGLPMEAEYYYTVKAKFWDKYGDGFIDNTVRIRSINIP